MIVTVQVEGVDGLADRLARSLAPRLAARALEVARDSVTPDADARDDATRTGSDIPAAPALDARAPGLGGRP